MSTAFNTSKLKIIIPERKMPQIIKISNPSINKTYNLRPRKDKNNSCVFSILNDIKKLDENNISVIVEDFHDELINNVYKQVLRYNLRPRKNKKFIDDLDKDIIDIIEEPFKNNKNNKYNLRPRKNKKFIDDLDKDIIDIIEEPFK